MALAFLFDPNKQFQSLGGVNEVGGFLRVFLNGTDDRATTYKNFDGTLNEADIELDANGRAVVIVDNTKTYRLEVYNRLGGLMWTVSNFTAQGGSGGGGTPVSIEGTEGEVDVDSYSSGGILHFVVGLAQTIKDTLTSLSSSVTSLMASIGLCELVSNKKDTLTGYEASTTDYPSIKAVVDFVNSAMQNMGGKLITDNGDPFTDSSDLPSTTPYNGVNIDDKDYAYVQNAGSAERWSATVVGSSVAWVQEYAINIPIFTPSQQAAIDSGITATMVNDLKPVAFSGSYNDLSDTPTIPAVNNGKLTISRNGTALGSFTANQSSLIGIDISVPTKTSDLVNDSLLINDGTLTIKQNGVSKGTFSANQLGNATINLDDTTTVSSVEKTALGQVNTLPVASMVSSAFKAGTFLLKATEDGGSAYSFGDITIPNNQWYRFTVNGESSNYCVITLEIVAGSASSAFGTFKLLVDSGSVKKVVRVPYATKTAAVGSVTTPVYVDDNGEFKESTSVAQKASSGSGNLAVIDVNGDYSSSGISAYDQTMLNGLTSRLGSFVSAINSFSHSFNVIFNGSDISKTLDFENTYASIKFLRFGISYVSGKISYRLPWSGASVDYNGWIIAPDTQTKNGKSIVHTTHTFTVAGNANTEELYEENELGTTGQSVASIFEKQITTSQTVRGRLSSEIRLYNGVSYKELIVHVDIGYERLSSTGAFYAFGTVTCNTDLFEND